MSGLGKLGLLLTVTLSTILASPLRVETAGLEKPVVRFGVIPRYNPMIMYRSYQPLMDYLTENTPYRFELKLSRDYTEAVELLRQGVASIASLGDVTFAEACTQFGARPVIKPLNAAAMPTYGRDFPPASQHLRTLFTFIRRQNLMQSQKMLTPLAR